MEKTITDENARAESHRTQRRVTSVFSIDLLARGTLHALVHPLHAGLPSVAVSIAVLLGLTVPTDGLNTVADLRVLLPVTLTIGLVPLAIPSSFLLRTATVTNFTAATVPFTTPEEEPF